MSPAPRKLLCVAPSAYVLSGIATWLDYLLPGLVAQGWDVTLGLVSGPRHHQPSAYLHVHPFGKTISIHCGCSTAWGRIEAVRAAIAQVCPSIVLTVNIPDAIRAAALERSSGRDIRAVMSCHGIQEDLFADMKKLHAELDAVICTNRLACSLAEQIAAISPDRNFHCLYGTPVSRRLADRSSGDRFSLGYSGRLEQPQKRAHDLVPIAAGLAEEDATARLLIAGSGPEERVIIEKVNERGLERNVEFLGFLQAQELRDRLYSAIDALVVTSSWETGPIVIWEAMAAGVPVVSSRYIGSGREGLLRDGHNCLLFDIGDIRGAVRQVARLRCDPGLRQTIRENAFQLVANQLSCAASVEGWDRVLSHLAGVKPRGTQIRKNAYARPAGRLDRVVGRNGAAALRRLIGRMPPDGGPGGEWPHTIAGASMSEAEFLELAARADSADGTEVVV